MKTFFLTLLVAIATITPGFMTNQAEARPTTREIVVRDIRLPSAPHKPARSDLPIVCAAYSGDMSALEVSFTQYIGKVSICIINDMGQCVARYSCDTQYEPFVYMNVALAEGSYTLRIVGDNYDGEGYFEIHV